MKKIGILGATFNPIHYGHIQMALAAKKQYKLNEVWFMPSKKPPHKDANQIISDEHRKRMIEFAIEDYSDFIFSDIEFNRQGTTYTIDTLKELNNIYKNHEFYFIMGEDSLDYFHKWRSYQEIFKECNLLVVARQTIDYNEFELKCKLKSNELHGEFKPVKMENVYISSSHIRDLFKDNSFEDSIYSYSPKKVCDYIYIHKLYNAKKNNLIKNKNGKYSEKKIINCLSASLKKKRFLHSLGVAYTASNLAMVHCPDENMINKAKIAGLLHDCAKYLSDYEMIEECEKNNIKLLKVEKENPALIHGKLGAFYAKNRYEIDDEDIISSIKYHTTGKSKMNILEKIIYISDYIEPHRKMKCKPYDLSLIRKTSFINLDKALLMILENTISYLNETNAIIDETTMEAYNYYKKDVKS